MSVWVLLALVMGSPEVEERVRDTTVEQPFTAGFFVGLTLGICTECRHGQGVEPASEHDPFAMSQSSWETLKSLGRTPYLLGVTTGGAFTILMLAGLAFRRINTLSVKGPTAARQALPRIGG